MPDPAIPPAAPPAEPHHRPLRGILWALLGVAGITASDTVTKVLVADHGVVQIAWCRYLVFVAALAVVVLPRRGWRLLATTRPWLQVGRGLANLISLMAVIVSIGLIPLAEAVAITYVGPLVILALAAPLLGERVGAVRWAAGLLGFAGMLLIIKPGSEAFRWAALLPLLAALFFALHQLGARALARTDPPVTTFAYMAVVGLVALTFAVPFAWRPPTPAALGLMGLMGLAGILGHLGLIIAVRWAPVSQVAPITYVHVVMTAAVAYLLFGELPDAASLAGGAVIVAAGAGGALIEARRGRR